MQAAGLVLRLFDQVIERGDERLAPGGDRSGRGEPALQVEERLAEIGEAAEQLGAAALDVVEGEGVAKEQAIVARHRVAEEEAIEAEAPRRLLEGGLSEALPVLGVDAPAHVDVGDPALDRRDLGLVDGEARAHRLAAEQLEHRARRHPAGAGVEEREERVDRRALVAEAAIGDAIRHVARSAGVDAEHRLDQRRIGLEIRRHHHDVARLEPGISWSMPRI